jgi:hypothetical protein
VPLYGLDQGEVDVCRERRRETDGRIDAAIRAGWRPRRLRHWAKAGLPLPPLTDIARLSPRRFAALFLALFAIAALPVLRSDIPPLVDYPNHLARMYLLADLAQAPALQSFYAVAWRPVPNLAMDAVVPAMLHVMPLEWGGKAFLLLSFLLIAGGAATLHRALFSAWSPWPCLTFLLLYGRILIWGFLGYLFALGLALFALAAWVALRERGLVARLILGVATSLILYFAHLMAFGVFALLMLGYEAGLLLRRWPGTAVAVGVLALDGLALVPPLVVMLLTAESTMGGAIGFANPLRKVDLLFSVFDAYSRPFDIACFALAVAGLALAYRRRWLRLDPRLAIPLALLAIAYLVMPSQLFTASGADRRLPQVLALLLVAGSVWAAPRARLRRLYLGAALLLFLARMGFVFAAWGDSDRTYAALLPALDRVPRGGHLAVAYPPDAVNAEAIPLLHLPVLAVPRREAFVPTLFAAASQQPIAMRSPWRELADALSPSRLWQGFTDNAAPLSPAERDELAQYDYIVFLARRPFTLAPSADLALAFSSPRFQLYRLLPPKDGAAAAPASR